MQKNVTYAFIDIIEKILEGGSLIVTRGNKQLEILSQLIQIKYPKERVMVLPHRNNNIFALIAETMWVLGGKDDICFLSRYLPRAIEFSDDGEIWRGAYGPRLRNWDGVDQFKEVARIINNDKNTKRAVMILYNPEKDYIESKDVPCNNWLHYMVRDGKLNLNVAVRANDAVWGFGGINSFEWSVLQEMMAFWTGTSVGTLSWFVGTIHIYDRHFEKSEKILSYFRKKTLYDFGIESSRFSTPLCDFDKQIDLWFDIERRVRTELDNNIFKEIQDIPDCFLRNSLEMIYLYNMYLNNAPNEKIAQLVEQLPTNDFKIAAIEYFTRIYKQRDLIRLNSKEKEFFDFYWNINQCSQIEVSSESCLYK